jgi:hemolysin D
VPRKRRCRSAPSSGSQGRFAAGRDPRDGSGKSEPSKQTGSDGGASEPAYAARVSLDQTQMQIDDKLLNLSAGMAVTVEIKTGTRRIIDYLLSPILRHSQESLRER